MQRYLLCLFLYNHLYLVYSQSVNSFHDAGIYTTMEWTKEQPLIITPQIWVNLGKTYMELRYHYEDAQTMAFYLGRTVALNEGKRWEKIETFELVPALGLTVGRTNAISFALNGEFQHKKVSAFLQSQYTHSVQKEGQRFAWVWLGSNFQFSKYVGVGAAVQALQPLEDVVAIRLAPMLSVNYAALSVEFYSYNFWQAQRVWAVGVQYEFD
ncbi:MAG: hypothetical protein ACKVTZ_02660 [Bacteroidia bacterium]